MCCVHPPEGLDEPNLLIDDAPILTNSTKLLEVYDNKLRWGRTQDGLHSKTLWPRKYTLGKGTVGKSRGPCLASERCCQLCQCLTQISTQLRAMLAQSHLFGSLWYKSRCCREDWRWQVYDVACYVTYRGALWWVHRDRRRKYIWDRHQLGQRKDYGDCSRSDPVHRHDQIQSWSL